MSLCDRSSVVSVSETAMLLLLLLTEREREREGGTGGAKQKGKMPPARPAEPLKALESEAKAAACGGQRRRRCVGAAGQRAAAGREGEGEGGARGRKVTPKVWREIVYQRILATPPVVFASCPAGRWTPQP